MPTTKKATLAAEIARLRADYAAACRELHLCRDALRRERIARWGVRPLDPPPQRYFARSPAGCRQGA